ncbi:MAG: SGNH/GDSL hydrolase family protein [Mycobacteriales bacterium]
MAEYVWSGVGVTLALVIAVLAVRVRQVYRQRPRYATYWRDGNGQAPDPAAIHLVTLGDSIMQGIGASRPARGLAGLAAAHIAQRTERPVRLTNLSRTGAKVADVLADQLPLAPLEQADIVLVCVSANDATKRVPLADYREQLDRLLGRLPADKTIIADVALVKAHPIYQPTMRELADSHGITRAAVGHAFANVGSPLTIVAGDFFHPNDRGYRIWFSAFAPPLEQLLRRRGLLVAEATDHLGPVSER